MRYLTLIFILGFFAGSAQDKLFFLNGTRKNGFVMTNAKDFIYFKSSDTSKVEKIDKKELILMEDYKGNRFLFSHQDTEITTKGEPKEKNTVQRNSLSIQPLSVFFGRLNLSYERFTEDGKIGLVIPLILTYDPSFGNFFNGLDSSRTRIAGIKFITGLDFNFYSEKGRKAKLFIGPRVRYGTDMAFFNTQGFSLQTQFGLKVSNPETRIIQHLSVGFGFVRVLSSSALRITDVKQSHMWYSLNYRLGLKW
jgi:hypothetical protein